MPQAGRIRSNDMTELEEADRNYAMQLSIEAALKYSRRGGGRPDYFFLSGADLITITNSNEWDERKVYELKDGVITAYDI
jgi:hypothetical protein